MMIFDMKFFDRDSSNFQGRTINLYDENFESSKCFDDMIENYAPYLRYNFQGEISLLKNENLSDKLKNIIDNSNYGNDIIIW